MKKIILLILTITMFSLGLTYYSPVAFAEEKTNKPEKNFIAILDLSATNISKEEAGMLSDRLRSELFKTGKFEIMEREKMNLILKEQGFQETGFCNTTECSVEIGQLLAVNRIVTGSVGKMGNVYSINLRLIDIETGKNLKTAEEDCMCPLENVLLYSVRKVAYKMADLPYQESPEELKVINSLSKGILLLFTEPIGAKVYYEVDTFKQEDKTPLRVELEPGAYKFKLTMNNFFDETLDINIKPGEKIKKEINLEKIKKVTIKSKPDNVKVSIDKNDAGQTPLTTELRAGQHVIQFEKSGYKATQKEINFKDTENIDITLEETKELLAIRTEMLQQQQTSKLITGLIITGSGLALGGGSGAFALMTQNSYQAYLNETDVQMLENNYQSAQNNRTITYILGGAAIVTVGIGLCLWLIPSGEPDYYNEFLKHNNMSISLNGITVRF